MIAPAVGRSRAIAAVATALAGALAGALPAPAAAQSCPLAALLGCPSQPAPAPPAPPPPQAEPSPQRPPPRARPPLEIGVTEGDPRLVLGAERGMRRAARRLAALRPAYVRVLVPWERLQPRSGRPPNWDAPPGGCAPSQPGCRSDRGLRSLLRAIAHRQALDGGWRILAVPYFSPSWAARRASGCQKQRYANPRSQPPRIGAYRRFLRGLNALADEVGVAIDYLSPWNEPNHPGFLQPQRRRCQRSSPAIAARAYARIARAAAAELRPRQTLVLGSLAGLLAPRVYGAGAAEFVRALPRDVACLAGPFAQHAYIGEPGRRGRPPRPAATAGAARGPLLRGVLAALDAKRCARPKRLWIAETGTFDHRCEAMAAALRAWARDPRVEAALQYTFRESRVFPVGLVSPSLLRTYGSYRAWYAFAGAPEKLPPSPC